MIKLNLIRLHSEKTIFKLFILESTENQLLGYLGYRVFIIVLLVVAGFHRVNCKRN